MPDGGTLLLGGLKFYEQETLERARSRSSSKIPILSFLFSRKGHYVNRRNLLVLITARDRAARGVRAQGRPQVGADGRGRLGPDEARGALRVQRGGSLRQVLEMLALIGVCRLIGLLARFGAT